MNLNLLAQKQYEWVESLNWHNKTVLEALALIASEIGEFAYEYLDEVPSEHFGEELADIMLRTLDLGCWQKVDMNSEVANAHIDWKHNDFPRMFMQFTYEFAKLANTARKVEIGEDFHKSLGLFLRAAIDIAEKQCVDLEQEIANKMKINLQRGNRGRII